jgi:hypothetical protein
MSWQIDFWYWWIFAVALVIIEILAPSFFALWMAIAAFFYRPGFIVDARNGLADPVITVCRAVRIQHCAVAALLSEKSYSK